MRSKCFKCESSFGIFFEKVRTHQYDSPENDSPENFWKVAVTYELVGVELFRELCNGYAGQGESERMNKNVKKFRTTDRNRQSHDVTKTFMELDSIYKMISRKNSHTVAPYLDCLREKINNIIEENEENALAEAERRLNDEDQVAIGDEEEEVGDAEYEQEFLEEGTSALMFLLQAAAAAPEI